MLSAGDHIKELAPDMLLLILPDGQGGRMLDTTFDQWRSMLSENLDAPIMCCQAVANRMVELSTDGKGRSIVIVEPPRAAAPDGNNVAGTAADWGVRGFARHMAFELGSYGIAVNVLVRGDTADNDVISSTAGFLLSSEACNITGMTISSDGSSITE
jgi:NAD(P)-dependent dehydrogenase (short-subunit alcohol dehydrogenase family)